MKDPEKITQEISKDFEKILLVNFKSKKLTDIKVEEMSECLTTVIKYHFYKNGLLIDYNSHLTETKPVTESLRDAGVELGSDRSIRIWISHYADGKSFLNYTEESATGYQGTYPSKLIAFSTWRV